MLCPKHELRVPCYVTPLMDRLSLGPLINPCSMTCSSPVTVTPCACCHSAVLCLKSYRVLLSGAIHGGQFAVYHGSFNVLRTLFLGCFLLDIGISLAVHLAKNLLSFPDTRCHLL